MKTFFSAIFVLFCGWMKVEGQYWRPEISLGVGGLSKNEGSVGEIDSGVGVHYHFSRKSSFGVILKAIKPLFTYDSRIPRNLDYYAPGRDVLITYKNKLFTRIEATYRLHFSDLAWWEWGIGVGRWNEKFSAFRPYSYNYGDPISMINYSSPQLQYPVIHIGNKLGFIGTKNNAKGGLLVKLGGEFWIFKAPDFYQVRIDPRSESSYYLTATDGLCFLLTAEFGFGGKF